MWWWPAGSSKELVPLLLTVPLKEEGNGPGAAEGEERGKASMATGLPCQSLVELLRAASLQAAIFKQRSSVAGLRAHGSPEDLELMEVGRVLPALSVE